MKKGFTLVELLAVIVIIGLLMTLAIPAVLKVSQNVKVKSYETKIQLIKDSAVTYGESSLKSRLIELNNYLKEASATATLSSSTGNFIKIENGEVKTVTTNQDGVYPAIKITVDDLAKAKQLSYDLTNNCSDPTADCNNNYKNIITNPINDSIINKCNVYVYYKNNRINAIFDRTACDTLGNAGNATGSSYANKY